MECAENIKFAEFIEFFRDEIYFFAQEALQYFILFTNLSGVKQNFQYYQNYAQKCK